MIIITKNIAGIYIIFIFLQNISDTMICQVRSLKLGVGPSFSLNLLFPDDAKKKMTLGGGMDIYYSAFPHLGIGTNFGYFELGGVRDDYSFRTSVWQFRTDLIYNILPYSEINPHIYSGIGLIYFDPKYESGIPLKNVVEGLYQKWSIIIPVGVGINFFMAEDFAINLDFDYNLASSDYLDDIKKGNGDQFLTFRLGFSYFFFDKYYILRERKNK